MPRRARAVVPVAAELLENQELLDAVQTLAQLAVALGDGGERLVARDVAREMREIDRLAGLGERDCPLYLVP